jgi:hypothetical protein
MNADISEDNLPDLETVCGRCQGRSGHKESGEWIDCHFCAGAGFIPTDFGAKVIALLKHNLVLNENSQTSWRG